MLFFTTIAVASPTGIIFFIKTLRHIIENLKKKVKERNAALEKTERNESFFDQMQYTKRARKPFDVLQRFWSKVNELIKLAEENVMASLLKKTAQFIRSALL